MKIVVSGKEIALREKDVKVAKKVVRRFLQTVKHGTIENNMPTLYVTVLAVMKAKTNEMLMNLDANTLQKILELLKPQF